ncbi:zinc finger protein 593 [Ixodes scapularis]|uniref:Zinc finger protein 593 homolog n=1 Tax=Ixodes scapularis TaxID=6945 RepID=B7PUI5_IXOSC|nr:zinc finger protein 593 [Ixodes scapularis]EEC10257.1 zinc finger protein, putative [Ixodes scapularis]|eukprot:XP_002406104.1 zinc finger protein, putative [Ixodes scapularis]
MTRYSRKKTHKGYTASHKKDKTKHRAKDLDQIHVDMVPDNAEKLLNQEVDYDLPGDAQFYCLHCSRYFIDKNSLNDHLKSKNHKRRLKALEEDPYSQEEAEAAAGMGCYNPPKRRKVESQPPKE